MIDLLWRLAAAHAGRLVAELSPEDWGRPTPCAAWTVRELVEHLVDENQWMAPLLAGHDLTEAERLLVEAPADLQLAFEEASGAAATALSTYGISGSVHTSEGVVSASEYLWQMFADHLVHTWDLAAATGRPDDLDPVLVELCARWFAEEEAEWRAAGVIGEPVPVPATADPQTRLLARFGRDRSAWSRARAAS